MDLWVASNKNLLLPVWSGLSNKVEGSIWDGAEIESFIILDS